jgi:hypothetical protein
MRSGLALAPVLLLVLAGCGSGGDSQVVLGTLERNRLELPAETNGPIIEIAVREGDAWKPPDSAPARCSQCQCPAGRLQAQAGSRGAIDGADSRTARRGVLGARARLAGAESELQLRQ